MPEKRIYARRGLKFYLSARTVNSLSRSHNVDNRVIITSLDINENKSIKTKYCVLILATESVIGYVAIRMSQSIRDIFWNR